MANVTTILSRIEHGDPSAAQELLPLVYDELRKLAAVKMSRESPGQTLEATALVHEAYLRLVDVDEAQQWDSRGHFFAAAAEAMRRILVEAVRRKRSQKRGGGRQVLRLTDVDAIQPAGEVDILELNDALELLGAQAERTATLAKLRIFAGFSVDAAGEAIGMSHTTAYREWAYAQAWLRARLKEAE